MSWQYKYDSNQIYSAALYTSVYDLISTYLYILLQWHSEHIMGQFTGVHCIIVTVSI